MPAVAHSQYGGGMADKNKKDKKDKDEDKKRKEAIQRRLKGGY